MKFEFVPLLKIQRDLYDLPRGMERFNAYISAMVDDETNDIKLPLSGMNPMGKEHIKKLLDELIALDADDVAAQTLIEVEPKLSHIKADFKVALVLADDLMGGWTNRYTTEFSRRFQNNAYYKRGWLEVGLWTSETPSIETVRESVLTAIYRAVYIQEHGFAHTLREMLNQEGFATAMTECKEPSLDDEDLDYTREVIASCLDTNNQATIIACLFGDEAAHSLGYPPIGLSKRAGFALALHDARLNKTF